MMKGVCYYCGMKDSQHSVICPNNSYNSSDKRKTLPRNPLPINTIDPDKDFGIEKWDYDRLNRVLIKPIRRRDSPTTTHAREEIKRLAFLPLSSESSIPGEGMGHISASPQMSCKPYRLWIDETIAPCFTIRGIYLGVDSSSFVDFGNIPAMMFRTGRWPLPSEPDKNTEFGIDLSSWKSISVAQRVTLVVNNISLGCCPFRGAMEVWTRT